MTTNNLQSLIALVIGFGLGLLWESCTHECACPEPGPATISSVLYDTIEVDRQPEMITIERARPRVKAEGDVTAYVDTTAEGLDTIMMAQPFEMALDTVTARGDSISARARFPPPELSVMIRPARDTVRTITRTIVVDRPVPERKPWYHEPAKAGVYLAGGFAAGYLTRLITEENECSPTIINQPPAARPALLTLQIAF